MRFCWSSVFSGVHREILALVSFFWRSRRDSGARRFFLAFTERFWRSSVFSGVHREILALVGIFWRSRRDSGAHRFFLAFTERFWRSSAFSGVHGGILALGGFFWRSRRDSGARRFFLAFTEGFWRSAVFLAFTERFWHSSAFSDVHGGILALGGFFWRSQSDSGARRLFLAFPERFWRSSAFSGVHGAILALVAFFWRSYTFYGVQIDLWAVVCKRNPLTYATFPTFDITIDSTTDLHSFTTGSLLFTTDLYSVATVFHLLLPSHPVPTQKKRTMMWAQFTNS
ncbi:hypothetical protein HNO89_002460 [Sporosarcina luteola]|nr:hypothetical protein [Sporosarcina luteola]